MRGADPDSVIDAQRAAVDAFLANARKYRLY